jgi:hypothetical protein
MPRVSRTMSPVAAASGAQVPASTRQKAKNLVMKIPCNHWRRPGASGCGWCLLALADANRCRAAIGEIDDPGGSSAT